MERVQEQIRGQIQRMHLNRTDYKLSPYTYNALESRDKIRTLKLHSSKDRIECSLRQTNYSEGDYQALSYCWGSEEKPFKAVVLDEDGDELGYLHLTTNLYHALCDLRDSEEVKNKLFWIDQICINQEEVDEKNHQVELMGKIYQNASRVITYLGPAATDEEEKRGMALLQLLHSHFSSNYQLIYTSGSLYDARLKIPEFPVLEMPKELQVVHNDHENFENRYVGQGWKWLLQVAFGKWTRRLWIVQEQLLNKEVVMLRGPRELPWDAVAGIPLLFYTNRLPQKYLRIFWEEECPNSTLDPSRVSYTVYSLWYFRQQQKEWQKRGASTFLSSLADNMSWYEDLECGDPRDRIFALLAISRDSVELGIVPDYSKSTPISRIFLGASVSTLKRAQDLTPLVYACSWANTWKSPGSSFEESDPDVTSNLPSWAYCPPGLKIPLNLRFGYSIPHPTSLLLSRPRFSLNDSVLILKGHLIDRISKSTSFDFMGVSYFLNNYDKLCILDWSRILLKLRAFLLDQGVTVSNTAALCRALIAEADWSPNPQEGLPSTENEASHFMSFYRSRLSKIRENTSDIGVDVTSTLQQCDSFVQILAALLYDKLKLEYFRPECPLEPEEAEAANAIYQHFGMHGRSLCVTEEGRTCNAMHQPSQGDVVAAFQGADRLFILRKVENRYKLIGEAYVDGLMKGEAYEGCNPEDLDEDIELV